MKCLVELYYLKLDLGFWSLAWRVKSGSSMDWGGAEGPPGTTSPPGTVSTRLSGVSLDRW